jgi:isoamylase
VRTLGMRLGGGSIGEVDEAGEPVKDDTLLLLFNASPDSLPFVLPPPTNGRWQVLIDTSSADLAESTMPPFRAGAPYPLGARALAVLRHVGMSRRTR